MPLKNSVTAMSNRWHLRHLFRKSSLRNIMLRLNTYQSISVCIKITDFCSQLNSYLYYATFSYEKQ